MLHLPKKIIQVLRSFEEAFSERVWEWAKVLLIGAILAKGRTNSHSDFVRDGPESRTTIPELSPGAQPSEVVFSGTQPQLLRLLIQLFVPADAPMVRGIDETIERRRGARITAKGISRDEGSVRAKSSS